LGSVQSAFSLDIKESKILGAGSGIVTSSNIPSGSEIFRAKDALWNVLINSDIQKTCSNRFSNSASTVSKPGRFCTREQDRPKLLTCGSCKTSRNCSKVRSTRVLSSVIVHDSLTSDMPRDCLERPPQTRVSTFLCFPNFHAHCMLAHSYRHQGQ